MKQLWDNYLEAMGAGLNVAVIATWAVSLVLAVLIL